MALTFCKQGRNPVLTQATDHFKDPCLKSRPDMLGPVYTGRPSGAHVQGMKGSWKACLPRVAVWLVESGVCTGSGPGPEDWPSQGDFPWVGELRSLTSCHQLEGARLGEGKVTGDSLGTRPLTTQSQILATQFPGGNNDRQNAPTGKEFSDCVTGNCVLFRCLWS